MTAIFTIITTIAVSLIEYIILWILILNYCRRCFKRLRKCQSCLGLLSLLLSAGAMEENQKKAELSESIKCDNRKRIDEASLYSGQGATKKKIIALKYFWIISNKLLLFLWNYYWNCFYRTYYRHNI